MDRQRSVFVARHVCGHGERPRFVLDFSQPEFIRKQQVVNVFHPLVLFCKVGKQNAEGIDAPLATVAKVAGMMKPRVSFVKELWPLCKFFFVAPAEYDEKTRKKRWKEESPRQMQELADVLAAIDDFSLDNQERVVMQWIADKGYNTGVIMNAFRLAIVGEGKGPQMFDITEVLGKDETLRRLRRAIEVLK